MTKDQNDSGEAKRKFPPGLTPKEKKKIRELKEYTIKRRNTPDKPRDPNR